MQPVQDLNVREFTPLKPPATLKSELPVSDDLLEVVVKGREDVMRIMRKEDKRLMVVVGPCSIHDHELALDYARRLATLNEELKDRLAIFMRVYFEKPRTTVGWKGLVFDPNLDGSEDMQAGLPLARRILLDILQIGLPVASEMLDPISPQYTAELVSWSAVGARTTESQTHREMASGLSMPVGFKNSTDGNLQVALDAMESCRHPHCFLGIDENGMTSVVRTNGNPYAHIVLRGGRLTGTNYDSDSIAETVGLLRKHDFEPAVMVDCSHANSKKDHRNQPPVMNEVVRQRVQGNDNIVGVMLESNTHGGNQKVTCGREGLQYGVSITDACMDWDTTEALLRETYDEMGKIL